MGGTAAVHPDGPTPRHRPEQRLGAPGSGAGQGSGQGAPGRLRQAGGAVLAPRWSRSAAMAPSKSASEVNPSYTEA